MKAVRVISGAAVALWLGCSTANAQGHVNLFVGGNFAGDAGRSLSDTLNDGSRLTWGADVGVLSKGIFGTEFDVAYANNFFGKGPLLGNNYVLTAMPSVIIAVPVGGERGPGVQPYATAGFGLIRREINTPGPAPDFKDNSLGYSLGFGINGYATTHFGIRADYRYFRNIGAEPSDNLVGINLNRGTFNFSRGTVGAMFRF